MNKNKFPVAVFLTDTHKQKDNLDLVYGIFIQALDLAEKLKCKYIFHGGDFFNDRIGQNLTNLLMFQEILNEFERRQITLVGIPGNHDKTDQESEKSYLSIFKSQNFKLFEKEGVFKTMGITFHFLPFFSKSMPERLERLKESIVKDKTILIAHAAFNGVRNNDGSKAKDGLKKKSVKEYNKVLVGHYHDSSLIGKNIYFTGSAYQANFGENSEDKGFTVIYDDCSIKSVKSRFKKFIKVKLDVDCDLETELEAIKDPTSSHIRFIFEGNKSDLSKLDTKRLDSLGIDYKFEWNDINEEILKVEGGEFGSLDKKTVLKFFLEYCKIQSIESKQRTFGLKILN